MLLERPSKHLTSFNSSNLPNLSLFSGFAQVVPSALTLPTPLHPSGHFLTPLHHPSHSTSMLTIILSHRMLLSTFTGHIAISYCEFMGLFAF